MRRKDRTDAIETRGDGNGRKGWGPFSGGQLTAIIITFAVLLLFPVGAWALTFSNVAITDPGGTYQAKVNSLGQLSTSATVSGSVTPAAPSSMVLRTGGISSGIHSIFTGSPTGKALVITSLTVSYDYNLGAVPPRAVTVTLWAVGVTCSTSAQVIGSATTSAPQPMTLPFPTGVSVGPNRALCLEASADQSIGVRYILNGYYIPASQCLQFGLNVCDA